jgi:hypothetical protein
MNTLYKDAMIIRYKRALEEIWALVHVPTKHTAHRKADEHYAADFDAIRKIIDTAVN